MSNTKYKGGATSISFKERGRGLPRGEDRIQEQKQREIDSIKLAKYQAGERDQAHISGLGDKYRSEKENAAEIQGIKNRQRAHELEAFKKYAATDVARLQGEADAKEKYANYLKDLAPKAAAAASKFAVGAAKTVDKLVGIHQWNSALANGWLDEFSDGIIKNNLSIATEATTDQVQLIKEGDVEGARAIRANTVNLSSYWAQRQLYNHIIQNKEGYQNEIIEHYNNAKGTDGSDSDKYNYDNAVKVMDLGARNLLAQMGMSEKSPVGIEIIQKFRQWGSLDRNKFYKVRKVQDTEKELETIFGNWQSAKTDKEKKVLFENLILATKTGWYRNSTTGAINNPNKGQSMTYGDASIESFKYVAHRMIGKPGWETYSEALDKFKIYNSIIINKGDKEIPLTTKFAFRMDEEFKPYWTTLAKQKALKDHNKKELNGLEYIPQYQEKWDTLSADDSITPHNKEVQRLNTIEEISKLKNINETERTKLYGIYGYTFSDSKSNVSRYLMFHNAKLDGDEFTMMRIYNTSKDKGQLTKDVKLLQAIGAEYTTGFKGFHDDNSTEFNGLTKNSFRGEELNAKRELSSVLANDYFQARILDRIKGGESISEAQKNEKELLAIGVSGRDPTNPYHTIDSDIYGKKIFANFASEHDIKVGVVNDYLYNSEKSEAAWDKVKNTEGIIEINKEQIDDIMNFESTSLVGKTRLTAFLKNKKVLANLIEPKRLDAIGESLQRIKEGYPLEDISGLIPGNVHYLAKVTGQDVATVMNGIMYEYHGKGDDGKPKYHIEKDSQSVAIQMNDGKYVPTKDVAAFNLYNEATHGIGVLPMNPITRECTQENRKPIEAFKKVKGLAWSTENGGFVVDNMPEFYGNNGVSKLIQAGYGENLLNSHGFDIIMEALYKKPDNRSIGRFNTRN